MTSAPPKPKKLFSDVDDVDFEPQGLTEAAQTEKTRDWDSETDEREEPGSPSCGDNWVDMDMSKHDPRNPCVVHYKVPCVIGDEKKIPEEAKFRQLATALARAQPMFLIACHGSEQIDGCDNMAKMMEKWSKELKASFDSWDKSVQHDIWNFQKLSKWLMSRSEATSYLEFWESLGKQDWKAISEHTLHMMDYDPFNETLDTAAKEKMMESADNDDSGDVSYGELQYFFGAIAQMANMPLEPLPECATHNGFRKFEVDANTIMHWANLYHPDYDGRYFKVGGQRYRHPHPLR